MENGGDILQLCRLCLVKDDVNISIFEEQGDIRQILQKISSCLPVKVSREDKLPKKICDGCSYKLDMFYEFWNSTANAEKQLLSWLGEIEMKSKLTDGAVASAVAAQQMKPAETVVKQEAIDPSDIHTEENDDDKSYTLFPQGFSAEEAGSSATAVSNEEPPPKRARRTAAVKAQIAMDPESDDDDDSGEPVTKVEDESEESEGDDRDPPFVDAPSTSADDQPGPSGVGKDGAEAPYGVAREKVLRDGLMCDVCLKKYPTAEDLKEHVRNLSEIYYCTLCDGYCNNTHRCSKSKMSCAFCKKSLKGLETSRHKCFHIFTRKDLEKLKVLEYYNCELCGCKVSKTEIQSVKGAITCKACSVVFSKHECRKQAREHLTSKKRNCKGCELTFDTRSDYNRHRYYFHGVKKIKTSKQNCSECGKTVMKVNLNQHIKSVHGNPTELKCSHCDKSFSCKQQLNRHMLVHNNEFKHECTTCGKRYTTAHSLRAHLRSHLKPFECNVCSKKFTTKRWRDHHLKTH